MRRRFDIPKKGSVSRWQYVESALSAGQGGIQLTAAMLTGSAAIAAQGLALPTR